MVGVAWAVQYSSSMKKMSDSAQVKMNVALTAAASTDLAKFSAFDLTQAASYALRDGVKDIDARGAWRCRYEDPRTADEEKRALMVAELERRGEAVPS